MRKTLAKYYGQTGELSHSGLQGSSVGSVNLALLINLQVKLRFTGWLSY